MNLMVTGFGPFAEISTNPSQILASGSGSPFEILEVSYDAVDAFVHRLASDPPEALLSIGVAAKADRIRFETVAHNRMGSLADVRGVVGGPGPIDPAGFPMLAGSLWSPQLLEETPISEPSVDAGGYLCNYLYYRALASLPMTRVGFLHVPPFDKVSQTDQERVVSELQRAITSDLDS